MKKLLCALLLSGSFLLAQTGAPAGTNPDNSKDPKGQVTRAAITS